MADGGTTAGIIIIGDEILTGKTREENASWLIGQLRELGVSLRQIAVIPDLVDEIAATVRVFADRYDHVFTSGGVGPTHDDLTMEGVARAFDTVVRRHPRLEGILRKHFGDRLEERNLRMADVPEGASLLVGDQTTWPVTALRNVYILPGIPEIFRRKFESIRERFRAAPFHLACVYTTDDEGRIAGHLDAIAEHYPEVAVGSYPRIVTEGWKVKVTLESKQRERVEAALADLVHRFGPESIANVEPPH
jgi:molybdenum cofactor synthesis domain-containing protein